MAPHPFERARPFPERANRHCIYTVEHLSSLPPRFNQTDLAQHLQMLGDGGLLHFHGVDDLADRAFLHGDKVQNVATAGFGDGVESVGSGGCACHAANICPYRNMSSIIFCHQIPSVELIASSVSSLYWCGKFMTTRSLVRPMVVLVLVLVLRIPAFAANSWIGTVFGAGGKPVAGATVRLHSNAGGREYEARSSAAGEFHFESVEAGEYRLSVTVDGKTWALAAPLSITDGSPLNASAVLSSRDQSIALRSNAGTQSSGGEHLSSAEVSSLPLNTRDFSKLLLLAAGTMTDTNRAAKFTQQVCTDGQRGAAPVFHIEGGAPSHPGRGGATFSNFNVDAIQEVQSRSGVMP